MKRGHHDQLPNQVATLLGLQGQMTETAGSDGSGQAALNPAFVEALMGLPPSWTVPTASAVSGMPSYLCKQRSLLRRLLEGPAWE